MAVIESCLITDQSNESFVWFQFWDNLLFRLLQQYHQIALCNPLSLRSPNLAELLPNLIIVS